MTQVRIHKKSFKFYVYVYYYSLDKIKLHIFSRITLANKEKKPEQQLPV